jgi:hypothetical protein
MGIFMHCLHILRQHQIASGCLTIVPLCTEGETKSDAFFFRIHTVRVA